MPEKSIQDTSVHKTDYFRNQTRQGFIAESPKDALFPSPWSNSNSARSNLIIHIKRQEDDKNSIFPICKEVTMLGSGKGCVTSPDITLHGLGVAPQHCFIERLIDENSVYLHPISKKTTVNERKVTEPVELISGDTIQIGSSSILQFIDTNRTIRDTEHGAQIESYSASEQTDHITKLPETYNLFYPKRNPEQIIMATQYNSHSHNGTTKEKNTEAAFHKIHEEPLSFDDYYDNYSSAEKTEKYRDTLESDNFNSKLARFEHFANQQTTKKPTMKTFNTKAETCDTVPCNGENGQSNMHLRRRILKTMSTSSLTATKPTIRRLNPYYSRGDEVQQFRYYSEEMESNSNTDYIIHSNEAVPTIGYKRSYSSSSSIKGSNSGPTGLDRVAHKGQKKEETITKPSAFDDNSQCSKSMTQLDQFSPSPDSMYSSHSSNSLALSVGDSNSSENISSSQNNIPEIKQEKNFSVEVHNQNQNPSSNGYFDNESKNILNLDQILAICTEYQEQIAKEIEQENHKSPTQNSYISKTNDSNFGANATDIQKTNYLLERSTDEFSSFAQRRSSLDITSTSYNKNGTLAENYKTSTPIPKEEEDIQLSINPFPGNITPNFDQDFDKLLETFEDEVFVSLPVKQLHLNTSTESESDNKSNANTTVEAAASRKNNSLKNFESNQETPVISNGQKFKHSVTFSPSASIEVYDPNDQIPLQQLNSSTKSSTDITSRLKPPINFYKANFQNKEMLGVTTYYASGTDVQGNAPVSPNLAIGQPYVKNDNERTLLTLKQEIRNIETHEMEALREMEIERALLIGEETSLSLELDQNRKEVLVLEATFKQIDDDFRKFKEENVHSISKVKLKLITLEKHLNELEMSLENFCGTTDDETSLLEKIKLQHELLELERKHYEDIEFHFMEEEINKETQRDELSKTLDEIKTKVCSQESELEQLRNQNRVSIGSSAKEILNLENRRQSLLKELKRCRESSGEVDTLNIPDNLDNSGFTSDSDDGKNNDLEQKLAALVEITTAIGDAIRIQRIKSCSPIDPQLGVLGPKTSETLREIEKHREYLLNEQGVQMLEKERQRVRELQKRVQQAVKEEWEKHRSNCYSYNSTGSDDSSKTNSDTPTESYTSDEIFVDKPISIQLNDVVSNKSEEEKDSNFNRQKTFGICQQIRQKGRNYSQSDDLRPVSDGTAYDTSSIIILRDKHRTQNRPLTRYLPVRGDEDQFDLRAHIESSGHQLELCPHIIVTATYAKGFLSKLGSRFHNWNKRFFVFDRATRTFSYFSDKNERKPRGGIHFQAIQEVYVDHLHSVKSPSPKLTFCVKTYNRVLHLVAPSPEAMRIWVDIIFTGAEGYQEFKTVT